MIYIYALACPVTGRTRYIGKCKNVEKRLKAHISKAKYGITSHYCARWISTLLRKGLTPTIRVLIRLPTGGNWQVAEQITIARYRRHGFELTNLTGGGDGFHDIPPEVLRRSAAARKLWMSIPENKARIVAALQAGRDIPAFKKRMSKILSSKWREPATKALYLDGMRKPEAVLRRRAASARRFENPAYRLRHSEHMASIWSTPERRQEAKERAIALHSNPEIVERRMASIKAAHQRPDVKIRMAAARGEVASRPEVQQKKSEKLRQSWADPDASAKRRAALSSDECRTKMSESAKRKWQDPSKIEKLLATRSTPEFHKKISDLAKKRATPEYRAMMAAKTKAAWASGRRKKRP